MNNSLNFIQPDMGEGHYYDYTGKPVYEVPRADGRGMRPTRSTDAIKLSLVPSYSAIGGMLYKPGLAAWINSQYVLSAVTLPMELNESTDHFVQRVVRDARVESHRAAEFGSTIHSLVEAYLSHKLDNYMLRSEEYVFLEGITKWFESHDVEPISLELSMADPRPGYYFGGRLDFIGYIDGEFVVVDWKTQRTKPGEAFKFYPEWNCQLSCYKHLAEAEGAWKMSVAISSTEPGRVQSFIWFDDPVLGDWGWDTFMSLRNLYFSPLGSGYKLLGKSIEGVSIGDEN